jgi:hypothetical protein
MNKTGFSATNETLAYMESMGLRLTFAYHCNRCDYLWFPKDFDVIGENRTMRDIFNLPAPKACARCKNTQWNKPRRRKRKSPIPDNIKNDGMLALPRIKAANRNIKRLMTQMKEIIPNFDAEFQKRMNEYKEQDKTPKTVIIVQNKKKKKKLKV